MTAPARLVLLASGGGRSLENLAEHIAAGRLPARIVQVISSRAEAGVVARCRRLGLPCRVIGRASHPDREERDRALVAAIREARPDWVVLAGWLLLLPIPPDLEGRVINIHPALLPGYGGRGFYGHRVHEAVVADRPPASGCTVHFASAEYDRGPILLAEAVPVLPDDDADSLAARVFAAEKRALPEAIGHLIAGRARLEDGVVCWTAAGLSPAASPPPRDEG
ncbi:MAG: phosphoribosylglycinamide formyltransferase [Planctomycetota bacterium]|nr:MAG: phosphoribosylglycinamide formyltransferase [Planctomycetota bacterium]